MILKMMRTSTMVALKTRAYMMIITKEMAAADMMMIITKVMAAADDHQEGDVAGVDGGGEDAAPTGT
jgi:hypothetical protein